MSFIKENVKKDDWGFFNSLEIQRMGERVLANDYSEWVIDRERETIFTLAHRGGRDFGPCYCLIWENYKIYIDVEIRPTTLADGTHENRWLIVYIEAPSQLKEKKNELEMLIREVTRIENEGENRWQFSLISMVEPTFGKEKPKIISEDNISDVEPLTVNRSHSGESTKDNRIGLLIKGGNQLFDYLRVDFESKQMDSKEILFAFGCLAGVACQQSVMTEILNGSLILNKNDIVIFTRKDNQRFILSSKFDDRLFKNNNSVDINVLQVTGGQSSDNQIQPILNIAYKNYMKLRGTDDLIAYGWLLEKEELPSTEFCTMIASIWRSEMVADIISKHCKDTKDWHILFSIAIQKAIKFYSNTIKSEEAYVSVLSGAMVMSKIDLFPETTEIIVQNSLNNSLITTIDPLKKDKWKYVSINQEHRELIAKSGLESALFANHQYCCINTKTNEMLFATFSQEDLYNRMENQSAYTFIFYSGGEWYKFTEYIGFSFIPLSLCKLHLEVDKSGNWQPIELLLKKLSEASFRFVRGYRSEGITTPQQGVLLFLIFLWTEVQLIKKIFGGTASVIGIIWSVGLAILIFLLLCFFIGVAYMSLKRRVSKLKKM